jgi:hypothetical protein
MTPTKPFPDEVMGLSFAICEKDKSNDFTSSEEAPPAEADGVPEELVDLLLLLHAASTKAITPQAATAVPNRQRRPGPRLISMAKGLLVPTCSNQRGCRALLSLAVARGNA